MPHDLIHFMQSLFLPVAGRCGDPGWCPPADVYRTADGWLVKLDLAGLRPEDIGVSTRGSRLIVRGSRRDCTVQEGCRHYRMEINYSQFERGIELPCELERTDIRTDYRDGMLYVRIRTEEANP